MNVETSGLELSVVGLVNIVVFVCLLFVCLFVFCLFVVLFVFVCLLFLFVCCLVGLFGWFCSVWSVWHNSAFIM